MTKINIKSNNIKFLGTREPLKVNRAGKGRSGKMIYELVSAVPSKYSTMRDDFFHLCLFKWKSFTQWF